MRNRQTVGVSRLSSCNRLPEDTWEITFQREGKVIIGKKFKECRSRRPAVDAAGRGLLPDSRPRLHCQVIAIERIPAELRPTKHPCNESLEKTSAQPKRSEIPEAFGNPDATPG
ncbi:unnamed protein product [Macrosiphum euphorbiae]|uniref:Uncharacterized protein n=1 Tax=Macrosiphum euphorbiae TaxID=13131 RepID=A0AAV0Y0V1_9HEMI|nr:unnamed protein product [Macrosiphum euphorbiae]